MKILSDFKNKIIQGDCLEVMSEIPDKSIDMICCDLPYGITQNPWDSIIPLEKLWGGYERIIKDNGAIVLTAQNAFTIKLASSNLPLYRYTLIWEKTMPVGFLNARRMPLQSHEEILVFYKKLPTYNPQYEQGLPYVKKNVTNGDGNNYGKFERKGRVDINNGIRFPKSVIKIANDNYKSLHPTQKPLALFEWLIRTYSNPGDIILDNCAGSGTTLVAAKATGRNFIGIELDPKYVKITEQRLAQEALFAA